MGFVVFEPVTELPVRHGLGFGCFQLGRVQQVAVCLGREGILDPDLNEVVQCPPGDDAFLAGQLGQVLGPEMSGVLVGGDDPDG